MKKISVITVNYNNKNGLLKTIQSVINQPSFKTQIEYLIIDGKSDDGGINVIENFKESIDFWVSEKDEGIFHAMNKGLQKATGEYVIYMNSGDVFCENLINDSFIKMLTAPIVYGNYYLGTVISGNLQKQTDSIDFAYLLGRTICHQSIFINRELCLKYQFEYDFNIIGDWIQLFKIMKFENPETKYINLPICVYDVSGISISQNELRLKQREEFLKLNYSVWELETLKKFSRLRTRDTYQWIMGSLDSYKKSLSIKWLSKIL